MLNSALQANGNSALWQLQLYEDGSIVFCSQDGGCICVCVCKCLYQTSIQTDRLTLVVCRILG